MRIERIRPEAEGVVSIDLAPRAGPAPSWEPGAHLDLILPSGLTRQYSLCGDPEDRSALRIAVLRVADGRGGSREVHDRLRVGQTVEVRGPRNHFAFEGGGRQLFIAGGIGITPILPMVRLAERLGTEWRLVYGGRTAGSMAFAEELSRLGGDRVRLVPEDERGLIDLDRLLSAPGPDPPGVYCCGPEPLLRAVEARCAERWPRGTLRVERFAPSERPAAPNGSFEVTFAQSGVTCEVPPDRSILEVAEEQGIPVLSSCEEGTCGTCLTRVLEGEPEHRDSVLTEEEREAGEEMLICVSRCRGPRLVLDA